MPTPVPEPSPDHRQAPGDTRGRDAGEETAPTRPDHDEQGQGGRGGPGWARAEDSREPGPVPGCRQPGPQPGSFGPDGLDYGVLLGALAVGGMLDGDPDGPDAGPDGEPTVKAEGRPGACDWARVAALAVEHMAPGAAQAGWLEVAAAGMSVLDENGLAGVAAAARQAAARAQACELAAVAQITSRAAAADPRIGVTAEGRPARVCRDALGQVALALRLTHDGAGAWADLAVTLTWRLPGTGRALAAGVIDLSRARLIAEATGVLSEENARRVEERVLPGAGTLTRPQLRERLARAVIAADPQAAEQRREQAERRAEVRLYADPDGTATLAGSKLPAVHAAAAMARITAIARAMQAAGQSGGLDLHRARVMLGLLLGTLPYIPPAHGAPPDPSPPGPDVPGPAGDSGPGDGGPGDGGPGDDLPEPRDEDAPPDDGLDDAGPEEPGDRVGKNEDLCLAGPAPAWPALGAIPPALARPGARPRDGRPVPGLLDAVIPWTTLAGLAPAPGILGRIGPVTPVQARLLARAAQHDPAAQWRVIVTNTAGQAITVTRIRRPRHAPPRDGPASGDGTAACPGNPAACRDGPSGTCLPRAGPPGAGLVGRITVTITQDTLARQRPDARRPAAPGRPRTDTQPAPRHGSSACPGPLSPIAAAALRSAARALERALARAAADDAAGGCTHTAQSPAYRPPPRLREQVTARDLTCRNPVCRQPAWRADLDHTIPYHQHGRTCPCNLGGSCRRDHQLKQHPRWTLQQTSPGHFTWTTPAGRTYTTGPDTHPV